MRTLHVDEFAALNDEIRALSRSGISLPSGLRALSGEYPGRVGAASESIATRLERGESLADAMREECGLPMAYAAVVSAGVRSGNLAAALEGVATTARRVSLMRNLIIVSMVYPLLLIAASYCLFLMLLASQDLLIADVYEFMQLGDSPFAFYRTMRDTMPYWAAIPPLIFLGVLATGVWHLGSRSWMGFSFRRLGRQFQLTRISNFLNLLALLIEHDCSLAESVDLASAASADPAIEAAGKALAERIRQGNRDVDGTDSSSTGIPIMIQWLILSGAGQDQLVRRIRRNADSYHRRAESAAKWNSIYLPLLFSLVLGGGATAAFGLFVFAPWFHFLLKLGTTI